jgi:KaiC/GvpD/RAD55 family RecA-like ATPase
METAKQQLLIEYLISSADVFALTTTIIKPEYFDPEFKATITLIQKYYNLYSALPDIELITAETGLVVQKHKLTRDKIEYCLTEIEEFCKDAAIKLAIMKAAALITKGETGSIEQLIKDALTIGIQNSIGFSLFHDTEELLEELLLHPPISTGYAELDTHLGGGTRRQQLLLLSANSGGGKSIMMANLGLNYAHLGLNVLYLTLELSVSLVGARYASMVTDINAREITDRLPETLAKMKQTGSSITGDVFIEYMSVGSNANKIRAFLKEFELKRGFVPDVILVDYIDLMAPNETVSADQVFEKDKRVSEQLRQILVDYNMIGVTASQQNRSAVTSTDLNQSHIAGGISKINTTDNYASIIFNDIMRAQGNIALLLLKTRSSDGVGKVVPLNWNNNSLRITSCSDSNTSTSVISTILKEKQKDAPASNTGFTKPATSNPERKSQLSQMFGNDFDDFDTGD